MPIPQLTRKIKSPQEWRGQKKKYYLSHNHGVNNARRHNSLFKKLLSLKNIKTGGFLILGLAVIGLVYVVWLSKDLPDPNRLMDRQIAQSTKIYDRQGKTILYEIHGDQKRTLVNLKDIPDNIKNATVAIEDKDFYKHQGFSLWAIFRSALTDIMLGRRAGGSTLTQQFIKNAILTNEKTFSRKIKEIILSYRLEKKFTKDEILQMYLNEIPYGSTAYGVEAASQRYFGKSAREVNLAEAAVLAAIPQAPSRYSPYGPNKDLLIARQGYILDLMAKQGYASQAEVLEAKNFKLAFKEPSDNIIAPHFVMYVKELLSDKYGEKMVEQGGFKIYTTLDLYKQKIAEEVIKARMPANIEKYKANNAALVSLDPKTGQILALVGSRDFFNNDIDGQVNVALQPRQPGSSFKPIVYTAAFLKGYSPNTVLYDVVTNFSTAKTAYTPHNYDNKEHGPVTIRQALAGSLNIPAVKTIYLTGINNVLKLAKSLGYTTLNDPDRYGLSLVLGGGEIKLLEHANAYAVFAREGLFHPTAAILKIEDKNGQVLEEFTKEERRVLDSDTVRQINSILSDNAARAFIFGEKNYLTLGSRPVGAKTGTTNDYKDAWTIGYTPSLVAGVWVGNNDNQEMKRGADGSQVAAPIWHDYMNKVLGNTPIETFNPPDIAQTGKPYLDGDISASVKVKIDRASGLLATEFTPISFIEEKTYNEAHSILFYIDKDNPLGDKPANPNDDPQFELWEKPVLAWAAKLGFASSSPPTAYDNLHLPASRPAFTIESLTDNQTITEPYLTADIKATAPRGVFRAEYYVDGNLLASVTNYPFNLSRPVNFLNNGYHDLNVKVCDDIDNCSEQKITFNLSRSGLAINQDVAVTWNQPLGDLILTASDFPQILKVNLINPAQIAKINFYLKTEKDSLNIAAIQLPDNSVAQAAWLKIPTPGIYSLSAQALGWNGQTAQTAAITVTIKEPEKTTAPVGAAVVNP